MESAYEKLEMLRKNQMVEYTHEEFIKVLKTRIRRWTGKNDLDFATNEELIDELIKLKIIK